MLAVGRTLYADGRDGGERGPRGEGRARGSASETGRTWSGPERTEGRDTAGKGRSVWTGKGWSGTLRADHVFSFREHGVSTDGHFGNGDFSALNRQGCVPCVSGRKRDREGSGRADERGQGFSWMEATNGEKGAISLAASATEPFPDKVMGRVVEIRGTGRREPFGQRYGKARMPYGSGCLAGKRQRNAAGAPDVETLAQGHARYTAISWGGGGKAREGNGTRNRGARGTLEPKRTMCTLRRSGKGEKARAVRESGILDPSAESALLAGGSFCGRSCACT